MEDKQQELLKVIEKYRQDIDPELSEDLVLAVAEAFIVNSAKSAALTTLITDHVEADS